MRTHLLLAFLALTNAAVPAAPLASCMDLESTVAYLTDQVARSDLTFIRNGEPYSGTEAAKHMHRKYDHFRDEIQTAEDFIDRAATRSLFSGEPYVVVTAAGERLPTAAWLRTLLRECRAARQASSPVQPES